MHPHEWFRSLYWFLASDFLAYHLEVALTCCHDDSDVLFCLPRHAAQTNSRGLSQTRHWLFDVGFLGYLLFGIQFRHRCFVRLYCPAHELRPNLTHARFLYLEQIFYLHWNKSPDHFLIHLVSGRYCYRYLKAWCSPLVEKRFARPLLISFLCNVTFPDIHSEINTA